MFKGLEGGEGKENLFADLNYSTLNFILSRLFAVFYHPFFIPHLFLKIYL